MQPENYTKIVVFTKPCQSYKNGYAAHTQLYTYQFLQCQLNSSWLCTDEHKFTVTKQHGKAQAFISVIWIEHLQFPSANFPSSVETMHLVIWNWNITYSHSHDRKYKFDWL